MFKFNTLIVTRLGSTADGVESKVSEFKISSQAEADSILRHPSVAGWKYGVSVDYARNV
jgi:hypothetical protein